MFISIAPSSRGRWFHLSVVLTFSLFLFSGSSYSFEGRCHDESLIHWYNPENAERIKAGYGVNSITDITLLSSSVFPGDFFDLVYRDGYLYLANGWQNYDGNLKIFDVSNPDTLVLLGQYNLEIDGGAFRLAFKDNCAYLGVYGYGLVVLDIVDPGAITLIGELETEQHLNDVCVEGDYLYLALDSYGLRILDISSPGNPQPVGFYETTNPSHSIAVRGDYAYLADGSEGITILYVGDPTDPTWVYNYTEGDKHFDEIITSPELAVIGFRREMMNTGGFVVVDISDPPHFQILSEQTIFGVQGFPDIGIALVDSLLFFAGVQGGFQIYDISNPSDPERLGGFGGGAPMGAEYAPWPARVTLGEEYAYTVCPDRYYAVTANDIKVVDISELTEPQVHSSWDTPSFIMNSRVEGDYAYIAASSDGVIIEDISDPFNPEFVSRFNVYNDHFVPGRALDLEGEVAFIAGGRHSLTCIDVSNPEEPQGLSDYDEVAGYGADLEVEDNLCAIAHYEVFPEDGWVTLLDVTDPTSLEYLSLHNTYSLTFGVDIEGDFLYVAKREGIEIVDISYPGSPYSLGSVVTGIGCYDVEVVGDYAYAVDESTGLNIIDVSDPLNAEVIGALETPGVSKDISIQANLALIADYYGLLIVEVSDPEHPELLETYDTKAFALGISSSPGYAYLADFFAFDIFSVEFLSAGESDPGELPSDFTLLEPYPNPFNASVSLRYYLPRRAFVTIEVCNLLGERVAVLLNQNQPAGYGRLTWYPERVGSGVYFCKLTVGGRTKVGRLTLLK